MKQAIYEINRFNEINDINLHIESAESIEDLIKQIDDYVEVAQATNYNHSSLTTYDDVSNSIIECLDDSVKDFLRKRDLLYDYVAEEIEYSEKLELFIDGEQYYYEQL